MRLALGIEYDGSGFCGWQTQPAGCAVQDRPANAESAGSYNMLAAIYIVKDDLDRAERNLSQALRINPRLSTVHYNWAHVAEKRGRLAEAEAEYLKELEISPRHFKSMYNLSRLYREAGDPVKEREFLTNASRPTAASL